jgi:hypothetical protein
LLIVLLTNILTTIPPQLSETITVFVSGAGTLEAQLTVIFTGQVMVGTV